MLMPGPFLFEFHSLSQLWIVIFIQGDQLRLSHELSHSMGVYKYFSIRNCEEQQRHCSAIKNASASGVRPDK